MQDRQLESAARWTPLIILAYFAVQFGIRVTLSANLETDEAQFVGQTFLALGYGNSHPPLYNWLVAGVLALTGGAWPAALALLKNGLLAGTYLLAFDTARRVTGRALTGAIVVASFMLLPQIVWKSQITLAHSVLVMFAVVAVLHAIVCIAQRGALPDFLWLGLAAGIGALAKYNFFLMLAAALIAAFSVPDIRQRLFSAKLAASFAVFAALFGPHLVWALQNIAGSTQRMEKMERGSDAFGGFDIPLIGIDGFLEYLVAIAAWAGPLLAVWLAIRYASRRESAALPPPDDERLRGFRLFFGRTALIGGGAFAAILIVGDLHSVHERYLTPILMPLPFWLALALPLEARGRAPRHFLRIGAVVALLMVTAWPLWILFGREGFAYPYAAVTQSLGNAVTGPFAVLGPQDRYAANIAIRLDRATRWEEGSTADQVVVLWEAKAGRSPEGLAASLGDAFEPRGAPLTLHHPYDNLSGIEARLQAQLYARRP
jgi:4-amino-4-deoxy-L-arabinose transferase-like glycosyltransferase